MSYGSSTSRLFLGQSSRRTHRQLARVRQPHVHHLDAAAMAASTPTSRGAAIAKAFEISERASELIYGALGAAGMIREMKLSKLPRSCAFGLVFAIASFATSVAVVYVRCLIEGVVFNFVALWPSLLKGSLFLGAVATLLAAVGGPGPRQRR
jgi:hypothetical protein